MSVDGTYKVELDTTMGPQPLEITLKTEGDSLSGAIDGHFGSQSFDGGKVSGNELSLSVMLESPMGEMQLDVTAALDGDEISGQVQLGSFRPTAFKGTRA